jgi:phosphate uptake regulator
MESRKVQLSGGTTYTVSLPKQWAEEHRITAGSQLRLQPSEDGSLLVEPTERTSEESQIEVTIDDLSDRELRETIGALYMIGTDTIELIDRSGAIDSRTQTIRAEVRELAGFEVLETTEQSVILRTLIDADHVSIRKSAIQLKIIALAMHQDAIDAVLRGDDTLATQVIERDSEADKSFALVGRCFQRTLADLSEVQRLGHDRSTVFEYYYLCRQLERIADHAEKIARLTRDYADTPGPTLADELAELGGRSRGIIEDAANVVLTDTDVSLAYDSLASRDSLVERIEELDETLYGSPELSQAYTGSLLLDSTKRSAEYGANIAALGLQRHYRGMVSSSPQ